MLIQNPSAAPETNIRSAADQTAVIAPSFPSVTVPRNRYARSDSHLSRELSNIHRSTRYTAQNPVLTISNQIFVDTSENQHAAGACRRNWYFVSAAADIDTSSLRVWHCQQAGMHLT